jgi:hypothetical protein
MQPQKLYVMRGTFINDVKIGLKLVIKAAKDCRE